MPVFHIIHFSFKATASEADIKALCDRILTLKDACVLPATGQPYIVSFVGGRDHSPEGHQNGFTHTFLVEFANEADRDYYVHHDQAHQDFIKMIGGVVDGVCVLDFTPGQF